MNSGLTNLGVLFATPELAPLIKTGGLADVSAALPAAVRKTGLDVRVLLPGYPPVLAGLAGKRELCPLVFSPFPPAMLLEATLASGVPALIVDCPLLYRRAGGPYQDEAGRDWPDNALRFGLLSQTAALLAGPSSPLAWRPAIVHCNDWQTGLTPAYLHFAPGKKAASVMTIHNLAFQGIFPGGMALKLGLPASCFDIAGVEYYGNLSFLKAGLFYSDHITTVSPTYAGEIQREPLGFGMQGLLASRRGSLTGILNGIDTQDWNPHSDPCLARNYDAASLAGKAANKLALQRRMGLDANSEIPLFGVISRFTHQKGLDLLLEIAPEIVAQPAQLALLGTGDAALQHAFLALSRAYPGKIGMVAGFDEGLSHLAEAGMDIFLMPSRFEPCGLNQMYSQRYGTPPVVHATGGLADSVTDCTEKNLRNKSASGFVFEEMSASRLLAAIRRAFAAYQDKTVWRELQQNGMRRDFSWGKSAAQYRKIYLSLAGVAQEQQIP